MDEELQDFLVKKKLSERASEEKFQMVFNNTNDAIFIYTFDGLMLEVNQTACERLGYSKEELLKMKLTDLYTSEYGEIYNKRVEKLQEKGSFIFETAHVCKDDTIILCEVSNKIILYEGQPAIMSVDRDITERKRLEAAHRSLVDNSLQGLVIMVPFRIIFANQAFADISGYTIDELLNLSSYKIMKLVHPDDQKLVWGRLKERLDGKNVPNRYVFRGIRKNGELRWLELSGTSFEYKGQQAIQGTFIDITDRKIAEQKLHESEEKYRLISENANDLIAMLNNKWRFVYINEEVHKRFLGYSKKNLIGKHLGLFIHPDDIRHVIDVIRENWKKREGSTNLRFKKIDGTYIWLEVRGVTLRNANGELIGITVSRDITERLVFEKKLEESKKKYYKAYNKITFYKDLFTHDVNNLFQIINSSAELIENNCYNITEFEQIKKFIRTIKDQVLKGAKLVKNIHLLSVLEDNLFKLRGVGVFRILNKSVDFIKNLDHKREIKIQILSLIHI